MSELQDHINALRTRRAPIPLTGGQVLAQARRLRDEAKMDYTAVAQAMGVYHGLWYSADRWRHRLRYAGSPPKHYANGHVRGENFLGPRS